MKKYKLLKDLPFAKAGETVELHRGGIGDYFTIRANETEFRAKAEKVDFDEWFEEKTYLEPEEYETFYYISLASDIIEKTLRNDKYDFYKNCEEIGNVFETKEDAEKALEKLKARRILEKFANYKPTFEGGDYGYYIRWLSYYAGETNYGVEKALHPRMAGTIYFATEEKAEEAIEKYEKELRILFDVED